MLENTGDSTKRQPCYENRVFNKHQPSYGNRAFNKRQPQDHFDRTTDNGEKDGASSNNNIVALNRGGFSGTNKSDNNTKSSISGKVLVNGCIINEVVKLMTDRWVAVKNITAEHRRKTKLNNRLYMLHSVVPKISKMDRASILGDVIEYLKELLEHINDLHTKLEGTSERPLTATALRLPLNLHVPSSFHYPLTPSTHRLSLVILRKNSLQFHCLRTQRIRFSAWKGRGKD